MNIFDIITALFAIIALLNGWRKGFISQLCSLVGILGGIALAITFNGEVGALFGIDPAYAKPVGFIITFLVTSIAMSFIAKIVGSLFSAIGLGGLDSLLGVALSMLKYALVLSVLFVGVRMIRINNASRVYQIHIAIHFKKSDQIFIMIVGNSLTVLVYTATKNCMSKLVS